MHVTCLVHWCICHLQLHQVIVELICSHRFECELCIDYIAIEWVPNVTKSRYIAITLHYIAIAITCKDFGKSFGERGTLKKHMLVHSEEKNFKCDACWKLFSKSCHLKYLNQRFLWFYCYRGNGDKGLQDLNEARWATIISLGQ